MADAARLLAKPQLRGLLTSQIKKHLIVSGILCTVFVVATKVLRNDPRKRDYAEFYKTYDADAHFQRMVDAGLMQCVEDRDD